MTDRQRLWFLTIAGGICLGLILSVFDFDPTLGLPLPIIVLAFLIGLYFGVAWHECGHLLAGLAAGFRCESITIGRLLCHRYEGRWRFRFDHGMKRFGGTCGCVPQGVDNLRRRYMFYMSGGILANLLVVLLAPLPFLLQGASASSWLPQALIYVAAASLVFFVVSAIPWRYYGVLTDGARVLQLLRGGPQAERLCALGAIDGMARTSRRPRDWDPQLIQIALAVPDGSLDHGLALLKAYVWELDRGRSAEAGQLLDEARNVLMSGPVLLQQVYLLTMASYTALHRRDAVRARELLDQVEPGLAIFPYGVHLTEAEVLLAEERYAEAAAQAEAGLAALPRRLGFGFIKLDEESLREILSAARAGIEPEPST